MKEFTAFKTKIYSYLFEDKKAKDTKKCVVKRKLKSEDYKLCLKATQHKPLNYLEKNNLNVDNIPRNHTDFIKNSKLF